VELRLARSDDAEATRNIYNAEVTGSTVTFDLVPRSLDEQREWIGERSGAMAVVVAEEAGEIVGFGALSSYRSRPAYATTVENSVFVHRDHRGKGVGRRILEELLRLASDHGFHNVIARIVGDNAASIRVHEACGFELVGVEKEVGRKFGRWLDVVELQKLL
jgi:phosphinothricin acetyltransferase